MHSASHSGRLSACAGCDRVEALLAVGASRREATAAAVQRALGAALAPALSHMSTAGLVGPGLTGHLPYFIPMCSALAGGSRPFP